jgi:hypothetical protein
MLSNLFKILPSVVQSIRLIAQSDKKSIKSLIAGAVVIIVSFFALQYTSADKIGEALDVAEQINETINQINIDEPAHE